MQVVKIRRVGSSNVLTLPRELEAAGFVAGTSLIVDQTPSGALVLFPESQFSQHVQQIGQRVIEEHREALDLLAAADRGEARLVDGEVRRIAPAPPEPNRSPQ
jgi:antitoxin component of MazEF toxin-antitoxin module